MKVLFLANNAVAIPLSDWLKEHEEVILWQDKLAVDDMARIKPDLAISYSYRHIIKAEVLATLPNRFINLHIALLPYNRGADPNAWSFLDNTPKGVTIHCTDAGVDTGPILMQKQVIFDEASETLGSSYDRLQQEIQELFRRHWPALRDGSLEARQQVGKGTYHNARELRRSEIG